MKASGLKLVQTDERGLTCQRKPPSTSTMPPAPPRHPEPLDFGDTNVRRRMPAPPRSGVSFLDRAGAEFEQVFFQFE